MTDRYKFCTNVHYSLIISHVADTCLYQLTYAGKWRMPVDKSTLPLGGEFIL